MYAIILAAGKGSRLQPFTETMPKCMVEIKNKPLIFHTLDHLSASGKVDKVIIVCGYMADMVQDSVGGSYQGMEIEYIINQNYETTNNVYSLYLAKDYVNADCLLLECDLYYQKNVMDMIMSGEADCNILVSPYNKDTMDGTIILAENGQARELLIKAHQDTSRDYRDAYKTVNIYKFQQDFLTRKLMPALELYVKTGNLQSYYELVLGSLIYFRNDNIQLCVVDERSWYEIDDYKDYERANQSLF